MNYGHCMVDNSNFISNRVAGLGYVRDKSLTSSHKSEFCLMLCREELS